jgi:integrase
MDKPAQTGGPAAPDELEEAKPKKSAPWEPPRGIMLLSFPKRPGRPHGVQWRVDGRRKTRTFPTREKQIAFARSLAGEVKRDGLSALRLNPDEAREWRAFRALVGPDADLFAVAACWERNKVVAANPMTVAEAVKAYTAAKTAEGVDATSISHYGPIFARLNDALGTRQIETVTGSDIAAFMAAQVGSEHTRRTRFARVRALFNWLFETGKLSRSPFAGMKPPRVAPKEVVILTVEQTRRLFAKSATNPDGSPITQERRETLGRLALEAFAGLRNDTAGQIVAAEILPDGLRIPAAKIKTRKDQFLDGLPANLHAWLKWSKPSEWGMTQRQYLETKTDAFTRAQVPHPHNCLRHGFASYHVAAYKDPGKTSVIMCHTSPKLLWDVYRGRATQPDGLAYFAIMPPTKRAGA